MPWVGESNTNTHPKLTAVFVHLFFQILELTISEQGVLAKEIRRQARRWREG